MLKAFFTAVRAFSSYTFIEAENGNIKLTANDMEIGIESYVEGTVIEEGKVAIEAKLLSDIVRKLPVITLLYSLSEIEKIVWL